ncbi:MAG: slipin family protein [Candidatus Bathyarchaeota archaeon]|nr:slipin family protein [Candidatus Bathyarchaeota archaeon]MDD4325193.1 slipin family protein [Candidatus Bathyarchaeota archaeon]MDI9577212.1 slipin family protein [Thermoproteota archaeon]MDT8782382.1 slipin family protein [Candidatus Bathyarchaeota archaeon]NLD64943.1 slipin family protein [Thermoproteota archaeon]
MIEIITPIIAVLLVVFIILGASIKVVREYERGVLFRLGRLMGAKGPGLFFVIPIVDRIHVIDLRTSTYDARMIKVITKDNIRCDVDSFVYYRVIDPIKAVVEVEDYVSATQNLSKTVLRDILGHAELDDLLTKTPELTKQIQQEIDEMTDPWGIKVSAVVISDVILPVEMQRAIAKQAEAERERRSRIILADGELMAAQKMTEAAELYAKNPMSLKLRELQMLSEISREKNLIVVTSGVDVNEVGNIAALTRGIKENKK